ncbi:MAG: efflux RND transporter periplasmic adaptor subunit [Planctomycetes bacterium]|nr:efflux RND transporter periplasmic adaptor subunit [Planctomycetota bacterium]
MSVEHLVTAPATPTAPVHPPPPKPSGGELRKWVIRLVILAAVVGVGVATGVIPGRPKGNTQADLAAGAKDQPKQREAKPVPVTVQPATARPVQRKVQVVGTMIGREEITVTAKADGRIVRINSDLGDDVKPGDVLLEIDDTDYKLAVAEVQQALELELSKLGLRELPASTFDVSLLPAVVKTTALERSAASRFERAKKLLSEKSTSEEAYNLAEADYKVAVANYQQAVLDARSTLVAIGQKKAVLDTARQRLADTKVVVPSISAQPLPVIGPGGKPILLPAVTRLSVSRRMVSEGEMLRVSPTTSMSVFKLVVDDYLKLGATVPERYMDEVKIGQEVDLEVEAHRGRVFKGLVVRMNPTVDPANRTFQIVIGVANPDRKLRAGSFTKASVFTRVDPVAVTVPEESLVSFAGVTKVFVVDGGTAREVQVTPGVRVEVGTANQPDGWVEVTGDLKPGAAVVTSGQSQLSEGKPVRVRDGK